MYIFNMSPWKTICYLIIIHAQVNSIDHELYESVNMTIFHIFSDIPSKLVRLVKCHGTYWHLLNVALIYSGC